MITRGREVLRYLKNSITESMSVRVTKHHAMPCLFSCLSAVHHLKRVVMLQAWKLHKENRLLDMKDATLVVSDDEALEVLRVLETAVMCVQSAPDKRPSMFQVAAMLAGSANLVEPPMDEDDLGWPVQLNRISEEPESSGNPLSTSSPSADSIRGPMANSNGSLELRSLLHFGR